MFFATPAGLVILTYGNGLVEVFGVAVHFAEMFLGRVGEFSKMVSGQEATNMSIVGLAIGIGLVFASLMYFSILVMKLYGMTRWANFFSFLFGIIAILTYGKFVSGLDLVHAVIYGASAFFIVLVSGIAGNLFSAKLASIIIGSPQFIAMQGKIVGMIGMEEQGTTRKLGRRTR